MTRNFILLVGAGGHARACIDIIEQEGRFDISGLLGLSTEVGTNILGYPVIGTDEDIKTLVTGQLFALVSIGQIKTPQHRIRLFQLLKRNNCKIPSIVSPLAHVSPHADIGEGTVIMHGAIVNAGAAIGKNCIINSQALIAHDSVIADHCHVATSATINSGVHIGTGTFIGSATSVRQSINIGENCLVGMGQRILRDCEPGTAVPRVEK